MSNFYMGKCGCPEQSQLIFGDDPTGRACTNCGQFYKWENLGEDYPKMDDLGHLSWGLYCSCNKEAKIARRIMKSELQNEVTCWDCNKILFYPTSISEIRQSTQANEGPRAVYSDKVEELLEKILATLERIENRMK